MIYDTKLTEPHLRVFEARSEYVMNNGEVEIFPEGLVSNNAKKRMKQIKAEFEKKYLDQVITDLRESKTKTDLTQVSDSTQGNIRQLVDLITSEVGRALVGLTIMQLCIKAICPEQSIRLHKGSANRGSFSWVEGISMRTLDKNYVTPTLRRHDLVRLNADGFMMTRSLAENYPYSSLYKAQLRGARDQWLAIVEELEIGATNPKESLNYLISLLLNAANSFSQIASQLIDLLDEKIESFRTRDDVIKLMKHHSDVSDYSARLLEISMHSLMQAAIESGALGDIDLKPLSQMRSANKKHGNVGDIELLDGRDIIESWDAKYGKSYLREEIEEAAEKIPDHDNIQVVGFVTNVEIKQMAELNRRIDDLSALYEVTFKIVTYEEWVSLMYNRSIESLLIDEKKLSQAWLRAYALTLAQRKRAIAPVDEPCIEWIRQLKQELEKV
ncbi:MAG: hypothetical protein U0350_51755 [Caldilineaceae bacterium]